jgi:hypothetical protein
MERTSTVHVAAVKKSKHGAYGKELAVVTVVGRYRLTDAGKPDGWVNESEFRAVALAKLQALLPGLKITTTIVGSEDIMDDEPSGYKPEAAMLYTGEPGTGTLR